MTKLFQLLKDYCPFTDLIKTDIYQIIYKLRDFLNKAIISIRLILFIKHIISSEFKSKYIIILFYNHPFHEAFEIL